MNTTVFTLVAAAVLAAAAPASAGYVKTDYSGTVYFSPTSSAPISFDVIYDTSNLVDRTASVKTALGGSLPSGVTDIETVSLSDDPAASLTIKVGDSLTFTKYDAVAYGTPQGDGGPGADLGAGNFPVATYLNGAFAGVGNIFINAQGYVIDSDPIADALGGFGIYQLLLAKDPTPTDPFAHVVGAGFYDAGAATITPAPEPSTWALLLTGVAGLGLTLRRRQATTGRRQVEAH